MRDQFEPFPGVVRQSLVANSVRAGAVVAEASGRTTEADQLRSEALELYEAAGIEAGVDEARKALVQIRGTK